MERDDIVQIPRKTLELVKAILDDECEGRSLHLTPQCDGWKAKVAVDAALAQPAIPPGMKLVPVKDPRVLDDLAALVGRLAHSLKNAAPDSELPSRALDYLKRNRLQGSPLREGGAPAAQPWIPVSEWLPDEDGMEVFVLAPGAMDCDRWPAKWSAEHRNFEAGGGWFEQDEVTHWMPTPAAPALAATGAAS